MVQGKYKVKLANLSVFLKTTSLRWGSKNANILKFGCAWGTMESITFWLACALQKYDRSSLIGS
jgi:hypothetical protein